jgi:crossover junction endodeoxyribonuclease RusA
MAIELTLPWPPSDNKHYRHARGRVFLSSETKGFRASVAMRFALSRQQPMTGPMMMTLECHPADNARARDIGNCLKEVADALQRAKAIGNDYDLWDIRIKRMGNLPGGKVVVRISEFVGLVHLEVGA